MGRRQFHAGEEGQGGNFELQGAEETDWAVFPVNSPNNFSANRSVVDSTHCT